MQHKDFRQIALYASHDGVLSKLGAIKGEHYLKNKPLYGMLIYPEVNKDNCDWWPKNLPSETGLRFSLHEVRLPCPGK